MARDPEDVVYPKRRWPWIVLLLFLLCAGAIGGFVAYVRGAHLATFRVDGPRGCEVRVNYGATHAMQHRTVTLPWETGLDVRGGDMVAISAAPAADCAPTALRCGIDVDTRARAVGGETCAEFVGRVWALVPGR